MGGDQSTCKTINLKKQQPEQIREDLYKKFATYTYDNCAKQYDAEVTTYARVVDIYDGDTITCCLDENGVIIRKAVRVYGIDTCEIKNSNTHAKTLAFKARNRLFNLVTGKTIEDEYLKRKDMRKLLNTKVYLVKLKIYSVDKYGRPLADIYTDYSGDETVSNILLNEKLAYAYDGNTKLTINQQVEKLTNYTN